MSGSMARARQVELSRRYEFEKDAFRAETESSLNLVRRAMCRETVFFRHRLRYDSWWIACWTEIDRPSDQRSFAQHTPLKSQYSRDVAFQKSDRVENLLLTRLADHYMRVRRLESR